MRQFFLILFFGIFVFTAQAQTVINGKIIDNKTSEGLFAASVVIKGTTIGAQTDFDGKFQLKTEAKYPITLMVSYVGYVPTELVVKSEAPITIKLQKTSFDFKEVQIIDSRVSDKQKQNPLTVESMDIIAIKETPALNFYEGLSQLKGVDLTSASIGFKIINTRGFNSTSPVRSLQLIDGVDNQSPGLNFSLGNFLGAPDLDVLNVDVVLGASSAFYGPNAFNGVISMKTKSPFIHKGLTASVKVGERNLFETAVRYAEAFKNKKGIENFAYKLNIFYLKVYDWEANNMNATPQSISKTGNPGGWDAVNRYGDEISFDQRSSNVTQPGLNTFHRTGYKEKDLVDYNTYNGKVSGSAHWKLGNKLDKEFIVASNFGAGTTVYQGDNRYSLKDILFFQNRLELRKENDWFVRAYATNEDAGKSYDAVFTATLMQNAAKKDDKWYDSYITNWRDSAYKVLTTLPGYPTNPFGNPDFRRVQDSVLAANSGLIYNFHQQARAWADLGPSPLNLSDTSIAYFQPGTTRFDSAFNATISRTSYLNGGSRFFDKSSLYHIMGEKKKQVNQYSFTYGGNGRLFRPNSRGTIFNDTMQTKAVVNTVRNWNNTSDSMIGYRYENTDYKRITNVEVGAYGGVERLYLDENLKVSVTARLDKNQNFNLLFSPAASLVYTKDKITVYRMSFSSAIRNPTLADQYLNYNLGTARLVGNLEGYKNLATVETFREYLNNRDSVIKYFDVQAIRPEKVKTIEFGYRTTLFNKLFVDMNYYFSRYKDFIGYNVGVTFEELSTVALVTNIKVLRVAANATDVVTTQGYTVGLNYFFSKFYAINGNYSYNALNLRGSTDPIIPAFNTPRNKFNIGVSGRDIEKVVKLGNIEIPLNKWGFNINYKWIEGFLFEGSPQFTGNVPTYSVVDAQINHTVEKYKATVKLGASNLLNNKVYQVYGGPLVGRLIYLQFVFDLTTH